jgi:hypothetical protein
MIPRRNFLFGLLWATACTTTSVVAFCPVSSTIYSSVGRTTTSSSSSSSALNVAVDTSDIKNGMTVELEGEPYKILSFSIMKQARGAAKTTIKFKNLIRGNTIENTYRSGEKFETALIEKNAHQYTYEDGVSKGLAKVGGGGGGCRSRSRSRHV